MKSNTINQKEINKFSKIAKEWWDPEGKFAPLHRFNPIRIKYIKDSVINHYNIRNKHKPFKNLKYEQFRWDDVNLNYYINSEGEFVVRLNSKVGDGTITYPQTDETLVAQPSVFTMDKNTIKFDSNEITFDRT